MATLITVHLPLRFLENPEDHYPVTDLWAKPIAFQVPPREGDKVSIIRDPDMTLDLWMLTLRVSGVWHRGDGGYEVQLQDLVLDSETWRVMKASGVTWTDRPEHLTPNAWYEPLGDPREVLRNHGWAPLKEVTG